jgi:CRISPR-associated protein Cmr1
VLILCCELGFVVLGMGFAGLRYVFGVSLATPMIVGWFEPGQLDPLGVRATEVKGLWRWWARAFVAGAMYDLGLFEGDSGVMLF